VSLAALKSYTVAETGVPGVNNISVLSIYDVDLKKVVDLSLKYL
jgi:hypothetical protein